MGFFLVITLSLISFQKGLTFFYEAEAGTRNAPIP
jgi:hypothetical protein